MISQILQVSFSKKGLQVFFPLIQKRAPQTLAQSMFFHHQKIESSLPFIASARDKVCQASPRRDDVELFSAPFFSRTPTRFHFHHFSYKTQYKLNIIKVIKMNSYIYETDPNLAKSWVCNSCFLGTHQRPTKMDSK